jgi:hypothetical protein
MTHRFAPARGTRADLRVKDTRPGADKRTAGRLPEFRTEEEKEQYWKLERERQECLKAKDEDPTPKRPTYNFENFERDWKQGQKAPTKALRRALRDAGLDPNHYLTCRDAAKDLRALQAKPNRPTNPVG